MDSAIYDLGRAQFDHAIGVDEDRDEDGFIVLRPTASHVDARKAAVTTSIDDLESKLKAFREEKEALSAYQKTDRYNYLNPFCLKLENQFHDCIAIPYKGQVVAVVNLDKAGCSVYDISHSISILLRDGLLKAGISFKYWSFETTPIYYRQACYAYEMGQIYNPSIWCYIFEDYALYHFIHYGSSLLPPRHLCHPALVVLHGYDKANGTDLLKTLEVYVQENCNAVTAAGELYIHRNTFYQRMNKIRELVNLNLDDPNVRLYLLISSQLIRMYYYELENGYHFPHE